VSRAGLLTVVALALSGVAGCGGDDATEVPSSTVGALDPATDKLAQIRSRGTLVGYHERDYPPQSMAVRGASRPAETKCTDAQLTASEVTGFDVETTKLLAADLGVEACFATPAWTEVTSGNWGDRWDIAYGSGSINAERMQRLYMTQPYYAVPNFYFVARRSPARRAADLDGKRIGACTSCSHESYLRGELEIPGIEAITLNVDRPRVVTFETEAPGLEAASAGDIDAFLAAEPVGRAQMETGLALRRLPDRAFTYYPSGFVDKSSGLSVRAFVARTNEIIRAAQADGRLLRLSRKFFGSDYVAAASEYDIDELRQDVK
jgi:polar amino acid transport system substrate-binding protein